MNSRTSGIACAAFSVTLGLAGGAMAESLHDALVAAYNNSNLLDSTRALVRVQDESVAQAVAALRPAVDLSASATGTLCDNPGRDCPGKQVSSGSLAGTLQLTSELLLYDGGEGKIAVQAAKEGVYATRQSLVENEQKILLDAVSAYLGMLRATEFLALEEDNLNVASTELDAARDRFELGGISRSEVSLVEARVASVRSDVAARRGELELARESYKLATGSYPGELEPPPPPPAIPSTLDEALDLANQSHPSIVRARHTVKAADFNVKRAETALSPRLVLGSSLSQNRDFEDWQTPTTRASVSITARVPLYRGGQLASAYRQGLANLEKVRADHQYTARVVAQQVGAAWARIQISMASIQARSEQVISAEVAYNGVREEASLGLRSPLEVLDAEQELNTARTNLVSAQHDQDLAVYSLLSSVGLLTAERLGLAVEHYSPDDNLERVKNAPAKDMRRMLLDKVLKRSGRN